MNSSTIPQPPNKDWHVIFTKLLIWSIFTVAFSLLPLLFNWFLVFIRGQTFTLIDLISSGELVLISVAINAAALGEIIEYGTKKPYDIRRILAIGFCVLTMTLASFAYSLLGANINAVDEIDQSRAFLISIIIFLTATLTSSINVGLSIK